MQTSTGCLDEVRRISAADLKPQVLMIDRDGVYPESVLKAVGAAGAYGQHLPRDDGAPSLWNAILAMEAISEACLSTAFCMWCQNALAWYIWTSENEAVKADLGVRVASGATLGGTALSNPMKYFFGIEPLRLKGKRCPGGYSISGSLPWVSNLGIDHHFGAVFELEEHPGHTVMAVIACNSPGLLMGHNCQFLALNGTRTYSIQMTDVFIPIQSVLADPVGEYLKRIRSGFMLLQTGMALGLVKNLVELMRQMRETHGHINGYLPEQPEWIEENLTSLKATIASLSATPFESDNTYFRRVIEARLCASELSLTAANAAMLHQGARGYLINSQAQRRLREAYFVAIVTPAIKQLRKMLNNL